LQTAGALADYEPAVRGLGRMLTVRRLARRERGPGSSVVLVVQILRLVPGSEGSSRPFADNSHRISASPNPSKSRGPRYGAKS